MPDPSLSRSAGPRLKPVWLGNVRIPAITLRDTSDVEWLKNLRELHGADRVHIGPPQEANGLPRSYWEAREMSGLYLDLDF